MKRSYGSMNVSALRAVGATSMHFTRIRTHAHTKITAVSGSLKWLEEGTFLDWGEEFFAADL
ncbi:MAG: hypothetical protein NTZ78_11025 [Candidatus Aureabacteria bacterium]|nr:hypothetical protein [Candidatus Auribacterota bacterium]